MIVLDRQTDGDEIFISIQRPDKAYTYLHWQINELKTDKYHFTKFFILPESYEDMYAVGPNTLVVWSSEDEAGLC